LREDRLKIVTQSNPEIVDVVESEADRTSY
jgi:hypothetical protein